MDIEPKREQIARYGLTIAAVQRVIMTAVGGENVTTTIEGRERYSVNIRYPRELRDDLGRLGRVLVAVPGAPGMAAQQVPLAQLADITLVSGPAMIRNENGFLSGYVYIDLAGRDIGGFVEAAKKAVAAQLTLPQGYVLQWSGQYENMMRVRERLQVVVPITLVLIFVLLYLNTRSAFKATVVMLAVPFSAIGAVWLFHLLDYNVSIAAWVGMIALLGLDAETGVFMLLFLDLSYDEAKADGKLRTLAELDEAILHGAVKRARPKMMTVAAAFMGLLPIMWSTSAGADVMKRIAAPMIGGLVTSFILELLVYPAIYKLWKQREIGICPDPRHGDRQGTRPYTVSAGFEQQVVREAGFRELGRSGGIGTTRIYNISGRRTTNERKGETMKTKLLHTVTLGTLLTLAAGPHALAMDHSRWTTRRWTTRRWGTGRRPPRRQMRQAARSARPSSTGTR